MEAILIEALEPLQNRRRGDEFDYEFTQIFDNSKRLEAFKALCEIKGR